MEEKPDKSYCDNLIKKIADLSINLEKANIAEYVEILNNPRRLIITNFIGGLARGFGIAIGATILGAIFLYLLSWLVKLNLPYIGRFIAEIADLVLRNLNTMR